MARLDPGLIAELTHRVTPADSAENWANELPVLATPVLLWLAEVTCMHALGEHLADDQMTLGVAHEVRHLAPTPVGDEVHVRAELEQIDGGRLHFRVSARDGEETVLDGAHQRAFVDRARFAARIESKRGRVALSTRPSAQQPPEPRSRGKEKMLSTAAVGVLGTGSYLPPQIRTNEEVARNFDVDDNWIERKTGVRERRVAASDEATSDLATRAGKAALEAAGTSAEQLDLIVVATSSPDWIQPATACVVQANLGAKRAACFDLSAVCTGFVYATATAAAMLRGTPNLERGLVIGADTYSRLLDYDDRATAVLFGDGAGAAVLGPVPDGYGVLGVELGADGSLCDLVKVPAGGSREPACPKTVADGDHLFKMNGRGVRDFVWERVPEGLEATLAASDLDLDDVDLVVPHQANGVLVDECLASLELGRERVHYTVDRYGNTGAASVAVTLDDAIQQGRVDDDDTVVLFGFGGGMTWGGVALRWWSGSTPTSNPL